MIASDDTLLPGILGVLLPACLDHTKKVRNSVSCTAHRLAHCIHVVEPHTTCSPSMALPDCGCGCVCGARCKRRRSWLSPTSSPTRRS